MSKWSPASLARDRDRRSEHKKLAVEYLGGSCSCCGYSRHIAALQFHHKNPSLKEFNLSKHLKRSWENLRVELDKCVLLCANCHFEHHAKVKRRVFF